MIMSKYDLILFGGFVIFMVVSFYITGYEETYLELNDPQYTLNSDYDKLIASGHTEAWADVTINHEKVHVDKAGNFYKEIKINNGENLINITAKAPFKFTVTRIGLLKKTVENTTTNLSYRMNYTVQK
jgi:hypothetical protein